jgi:shikimate dehydrogenase
VTTTPERMPAPRRSVLIGLIGEGVGPSLTPPMHELEGARHDMHYVYRTLDLRPGENSTEAVGGLLDAAQRLGFTGVNVTHPIKQTVLPLLDELAESARRVGAVNTVVFTPSGRVGHNTDTTGFAEALDQMLPDAPRDRVVLVGAGGAGAAVAYALMSRGVGELTIVDVDDRRAAVLAAAVGDAGATVAAASADRLPDLLSRADGVVNATPFGMAAHPGTAFDVGLLHARMFVADIVYRPVETALLAAARARGCRVMSGLAMAMHQAADAFEIFTGEPADRQAMLADLENLVAVEAAGTLAPVAHQ